MSGEKARPRNEEPAALAWAGAPRRGTSVERMESRGAESVRRRINDDDNAHSSVSTSKNPRVVERADQRIDRAN